MTNYYSNNDRGFSLLMIVENVSNSVNITNNTSSVRARLYLRNTNLMFSGQTISGSMTIHTSNYTYSATPSMLSTNMSILLLDKTFNDIKHDDDGSKYVAVGATISGQGGFSPNKLTIKTVAFYLPEIQRASTVEVNDLDIGSVMTINITRQSTSFTHTVRYNWNGKTGTIGSSVGASTTWTVPMDFCNDVPNSDYYWGTIYVDTYNGSTLIGTNTDVFKGYVPKTIVPTLTGLTITDANSKVPTVVGTSKFVQIMSNPSVTFNGASGAYGSTIKSYNAEIVGRNQTTGNNGGTLGIMTWNGTATVKATVTDSRGRISAPFTTTIDVLPYSGVVVDFTVMRGGADGTQIVVNVTASISPLLVNSVQKNKMTLQFKTAPYGTQTFTFDTSSASTTYTDRYQLLNRSFVLSGTFASDKSFDVYATLTDSFGTNAVKASQLLANFVALAIADGGTVATSGIGIGKEWEHGSVDTAGDIYTLGKIFIKNKQLLDIFYPVGTIYESTKSDNPSTFMGGTWARFGNGQVLVGVNEADTDFNVANKTGGEKTHILTVNEMPSHDHNFKGGANAVGDGYGYTGAKVNNTGGSYQLLPKTDPTGGDQAHNNLQPYVTVYRWQRTA